ncbi:MAG: hypothetical protein K2K96_08865 [Lachnospiraceae bacterium]|nr:hypothetical protein [Lachnospiraceae bacterium]
MKTKIIKSIILIIMFIVVTGCSSDEISNENTLYETDIIGEWVCQVQDGDLHLRFDESICTHEEYLDHYEYKSYTINQLNDYIAEIQIDGWYLDKFYNILGNYYETENEIPNTETFDLTIENYEFLSDGCVILFDIYNNNRINICSYNYYKKENIIFDKDTNEILFYIVGNGIFSPQYYKVE